MSTLHTFQPTVIVTPREDGRYDVEFDWSDAYIGGHDPETEHEADEEHPDREHAVSAIDRLRLSLPATYVTPAAIEIVTHEMRPCGHPADLCPAPGCCTDCGQSLAWDGSGGYEHARTA